MKYDVRIHNLRADGAVKAYASVNLNGEFAITGVKIMEGTKGTFVSMPSYKSNGEYKGVCFPITADARNEFNKAVLDGYEQALSQLQSKSQKKGDMPTQDEELTQGQTEDGEPTASKGKGARGAKAPKTAESTSPEMTMQ